MATHSSILARKSHGQKSLASYRPWGRKSQTQLSDETPTISSFISDVSCLNTILSSPSVAATWQFSRLHQC